MSRVDKHVYHALRDAGAELDSRESDLYVKLTPAAQDIVRQYGIRAPMFRSQRDGGLWFELPFCYLPWWEARQPRGTS